MKVSLQQNERGFMYFELRAGSHDHVRTRVWVHRSLVRMNPEGEAPYELSFPIIGAKIHRTEKGNLVLRPEPDWWVALVTEKSGYRGMASIRIEGVDGEVEIVAAGKEFHSPQGSLGETAWALINANAPQIKIHAHISGRRISRPEFSYILLPTGEIIEAVEEEVEKLLE